IPLVRRDWSLPGAWPPQPGSRPFSHSGSPSEAVKGGQDNRHHPPPCPTLWWESCCSRVGTEGASESGTAGPALVRVVANVSAPASRECDQQGGNAHEKR